MLSKQIISLLTAAFIWGIIWYPYRILQNTGVEGWVSTALSYIFALFLGFVFLGFRLRNLRFSWPLFSMAASAGLCNFTYVIAMIEGEVMRVLLLFYLAPFWTVILSRGLLAEKPSWHGYLVVFLSVAGGFVMLWKPESGVFFPQNGAEWLGLASGFLFALSNVLARFCSQASVEEKSISVSAGVVLVGLAYLLIFSPKLPEAGSMPLIAWVLLFLLGLVIFSVNVVVQYGLSHTPANRAIVIFLFELVVAAISSYFLAQEMMSAGEWAGGIMIIAAGFFSGKLNTT